jgi:uncharacterized protein YegP (UPF0339 family)
MSDHGNYALRRSGEQFYFNLRAAGNAEVILTSELYTRKASALEGIESLRGNARLDGRYERKLSSSLQPYFVLKAGNGEVLGASEMYSSASARESGIDAVKRNAPSALLLDQS